MPKSKPANWTTAIIEFLWPPARVSRRCLDARREIAAEAVERKLRQTQDVTQELERRMAKTG